MVNLKKKNSSLRVGVLVIAAFALLGSMMFPSISEKMGLDESRSLAYGSWSGSGSGSGSEAFYNYYTESYFDECDTAYYACIAKAESFEGAVGAVTDGSGQVLIYVSYDVDGMKAYCEEDWEACCEANPYD